MTDGLTGPQSKMDSGQWAVTMKFGHVHDLADPQVDGDAAQQVGIDRGEAVLAAEPVDHPAGRVLGRRHQVRPDPVGRVAPADGPFGRGARRGQELGRGHVQVLADRQPDAWPASASRSRCRRPRRRPARRGRRRRSGARPSWNTGRNSVAPAVRWRVSMFPPWTSGGIVERGPSTGATPISPQNGMTGTRMPGRNSARSPTAGQRA